MRKRELARFASDPAADTDTQERGDGEDIHVPGVELTGSEGPPELSDRHADSALHFALEIGGPLPPG
jgi:hypothetical protein